jgi:N-acetyl-beta-hexosaminidase
VEIRARAAADLARAPQVLSHPKLTAPEFQLRNKGSFYTQDEIRRLLAFCRERGVIVIPEIDMPGHSAAFEWATGHSTQSAEGTAILEDGLEDVCELLDGPCRYDHGIFGPRKNATAYAMT